jgi:hypothetical protein
LLGCWLPFLLVPNAAAVQLQPGTVQAFNSYIHNTEARLEAQHRDGKTFLWCAGSAERRKQVLAGEILSQPWNPNGETKVPGGLIHDWIGAVFIPGVTLDKTLRMIQDYNNHKNIYRPEVMDSKLVSHKDDDFTVYMRLLKKKVLTVVLNTNHDARYFPLDAKHCHSRSYSTRIAEVQNPGKPGEHELPVGNDHGFLWRLYTYWRFAEADGGVYVECEAISLTRGVPPGLGWLINPIISDLPRESLANTLLETRSTLAK